MSEAREHIRLFLGVEISMAAVRELTTVAEALRRKARAGGPRVRWTAPEGYHVTLKFLGWCRPEAIAVIADALAEPLGEVRDFAITGRGLGAFPRPEHARVLWAGIDDPTGGLRKLADIVEAALEPIGFAREHREFHAHVTLGRIRQPEDVHALLDEGSEKMFRECRVGAVTLFESVLKSSGSEYLARARLGLGTAAAGAKRQTESLKTRASTGAEAAAGPAWQAADPDDEDDTTASSIGDSGRIWDTGSAASDDEDDQA
jgi:2'-5' RNA ligase